MFRIARTRADHSNRWVGNHKFEHKLCPGVRIKLGCPSGKWPVSDARPHPIPTEGHVDQYANLAFEREGKDDLFGHAIVDRVVNADEIYRFISHYFDEC